MGPGVPGGFLPFRFPPELSNAQPTKPKKVFVIEDPKISGARIAKAAELWKKSEETGSPYQADDESDRNAAAERRTKGKAHRRSKKIFGGFDRDPSFTAIESTNDNDNKQLNLLADKVSAVSQHAASQPSSSRLPTPDAALRSSFDVAISRIKAANSSNGAGPSTPSRKRSIHRISCDGDDSDYDGGSSEYDVPDFDFQDALLADLLDNPEPTNSQQFSHCRA